MPRGTLCYAEGNASGKHTGDCRIFTDQLSLIYNWVCREKEKGGETNTILMFDGASYHTENAACEHLVDEDGYFTHRLTEEDLLDFHMNPTDHRYRKIGKIWTVVLQEIGITTLKLAPKTTSFSQPVEMLFGALKGKLGRSDAEPGVPTLAQIGFWKMVHEQQEKCQSLMHEYGYSIEAYEERNAYRLQEGSIHNYRCLRKEPNSILDRCDLAAQLAVRVDDASEDFVNTAKRRIMQTIIEEKTQEKENAKEKNALKKSPAGGKKTKKRKKRDWQ